MQPGQEKLLTGACSAEFRFSETLRFSFET